MFNSYHKLQEIGPGYASVLYSLLSACDIRWSRWRHRCRTLVRIHGDTSLYIDSRGCCWSCLSYRWRQMHNSNDRMVLKRQTMENLHIHVCRISLQLVSIQITYQDVICLKHFRKVITTRQCVMPYTCSVQIVHKDPVFVQVNTNYS